MIKVGVLGLGNMGKLHFLNALHMKGVDVVAAADKHKRNLRKAMDYKVKTYDDYRKLLDSEDLDAVIISLPNFLKKESIKRASEKDLDIFVDKPLARTLKEAESIIRSVRSNGARLMVGVNYRYIDCIQRLKEILDEGRIGEVMIGTGDLIINGPFAHSLVPKPVPEWWFDKRKSGGGALLDLGYHLIDIFQWMLGELSILYSTLQFSLNLPIEDAATVVLESQETSAKIVINVGWFSKTIFPEFNFRVNLHGTVGYASTDQFAPRNLYTHAMKAAAMNFLRRITNRKIRRLSYTYYYSSFTKILEDFFGSVSNDSAFPVSLRNQLRVIATIDKIYRKNGVDISG